MVKRYVPPSKDSISGAMPASRIVGRASIKQETIRRVAREGRDLRDAEKQGRELRSGPVADAFQNFALNLGVGTDNALTGSQYGFFPVTRVRTLLDFVHRGSWLGGIAVDLLAEDMTRGGVEILTVEDPKQVEKLQQGLIRLQIWKKLCSTVKWANLYGGCLAVILIDGQDPSTPLRIETVRKDQFKGLMVLDRWMVDPTLQDLVTDLGPHLGLPKFYRVVSDAPAMRGQKIHYTRCVRLIGIELPYWQSIMENLWGLSIFERLWDRMIAFDSATMGAAQLVYKSYLRTYKIDGLHEAAVAAGDALVGITKRVEFMRKYQGIEGMTLLDKDDDFATHETSSFSGIADVLVHFAEQLSGSLQIPLVRLMGQSPAGLNSTGESDLRTYYDNILQRQESEMREGVNLILRVLARSLSIDLPEEFNFNFVPLWQLNESEKSEVADKVTRMVLEAYAAGLISEKVALQELRQIARVTGKWTNIDDKTIANANDLPEPPEAELGEGGEMIEGAMPPGAAGKGEEGPSAETGGKAAPIPKNAPAASPEASPEGGAVKRLEQFEKIRQAVGGGKDAAINRTLDQYSLPYTQLGGLQVVVEQRAGTIRRGEGWAVVMSADYGYIRRVGSAEGPDEWLDVFIGPNHDSRDIWVVDVVVPDTGKFDEHKVLLGFNSARDAIDCFKKSYNDGAAKRIGGITHMSMDSEAWKTWLAKGDKNVPLAMDRRQAA